MTTVILYRYFFFFDWFIVLRYKDQKKWNIKRTPAMAKLNSKFLFFKIWDNCSLFIWSDNEKAAGLVFQCFFKYFLQLFLIKLSIENVVVLIFRCRMSRGPFVIRGILVNGKGDGQTISPRRLAEIVEFFSQTFNTPKSLIIQSLWQNN